MSSTSERPSASMFATVYRPTALFAALLVIAVVGTGCGGGEAQSSQSAAQTASSDTAQAEHEGEHEGEHSPRAVEIGAEKAESLGIQVRELTAGSATSTVSRPATVEFNPDRVAMIGPRVEGKVVHVTKDLGDQVQEGETVAVLSSVELGRARSEYLSAQAHLQTARQAYQREQTLFQDSISSEASFLEAKAQFEEAKARLQSARETLRIYGAASDTLQPAEQREVPLSNFRMTSPVTGTLQKRDVQIGQTVGTQETPFHVASGAQMWVMIDGYERDVPVVKKGQPVRLTVSGMEGTSFEGQVDFISQTLEEETRTLRMRAVVDNPSGQLRDGMYGRAHISTDATVKRALISTDAVQTIDGTPMVFVPGDEDGHFRAVEVRLGEESQDGMVELLAGLQPGDEAVTQGAFNLKATLTSQSRHASH